MTCQQCIDRWGAEPSEHGDSAEELIAYYQHLKFHLNNNDVLIPWFWIDKVNDYV